jgi:hypothetical protein
MRWKTDMIADWNKWSRGERVLALLLALLLLLAPAQIVVGLSQ